MALRALSSRLPAVHHHSLSFTKLRYPQTQWTIPSRFFSARTVCHPSNLVQVYISRSTDPYLNLSIEHFLLQNTHPDSVVLLLYTNRPCIVIGRNQNPWVEVNLGLVNQADGTAGVDNNGDVLLVRRRSGGGTVFHDAGNVNYSVICPPASFDRDKHAEMVVRALQGLLGLRKIPHGVRVNERHDIVLDVDTTTSSESHDDVNARKSNNEVKTFKISGSAYKLTRTRSLHHGTCLLTSPHLHLLGKLLRSPAAPYIKARGVESVRSPVRNVGISNVEFENAVVSEFLKMYDDTYTQLQDERRRRARNNIKVEIILEADVQDIPQIRAGVAELRSRDWIYAQTPQFTFSSHPTAEDPRPRPDLPPDLRASFFSSGSDRKSSNVVAPGMDASSSNSSDLVGSLKGLHLHRIEDWRGHVGGENESMGRWLNERPPAQTHPPVQCSEGRACHPHTYYCGSLG
ncbi:hypothetical protein F5Y08DRAFT_333723 [Xylaria arbuscula]|nr:hypothetical protein F5Y08DRAFT_333723 [Xylaria arbuscula]